MVPSLPGQKGCEQDDAPSIGPGRSDLSPARRGGGGLRHLPPRPRGNRINSWNAGAQRIKGYAADEVIGRPFAIFFTEEDRRARLPEVAVETARRDGRFEAEAGACGRMGPASGR
ncbi:PAS domain-containing protein [Dankookia sp. P2]|uniref:PAS domain-containing protein n=1 Tax=Dankookia sp. P2 TaxID=3423955 RepID=UPI003D66C995